MEFLNPIYCAFFSKLTASFFHRGNKAFPNETRMPLFQASL